MRGNKAKPCKDCVYWSTPSCVGTFSRIVLIEDYQHDCFTTAEDLELCEMMCGGVEDEEV